MDEDEDEVDRLVAAWARERPDLDIAPLEVLSRVSRLARHLDRGRRSAFARSGLEGWEFDVLAALRRAGAPYELSPGRLLTQTLVTSGTMTNRIDRLASRGLVARRPDPTDRRGVQVRLTPAGREAVDDRRGVQVRLTPAGREAVDAALEALLGHERELLRGLSPRERARTAGLLRRLLVSFDNEPTAAGQQTR